MKNIALYAGSFDPLTLGHINIIERALELFDEVVVGIGVNPAKKYTFSLGERMDFIQSHFGGQKRLSVVAIAGLAVDCAKLNGAKYIIKGVRTTQDFDYERLINDVSLTQQRDVETVLLFSDHRLSHVSSSAVKELSKHVGVINNMVTPLVRRELDKKNGRFVIGVTGTIGSGKSTLCRRLSEEYDYVRGVENHYVNLDAIAHNLFDGTGPMSQKLRNDILSVFRTIDKKELGELVFGDRVQLNKLNDLYREPMVTMLRQELSKRRGIIFLEGALLLEFGWEFVCSSGTVIIVDTPEETEHRRRLSARGYTDVQIENRINSQLSFDEKYKLAESAKERGEIEDVVVYGEKYINDYNFIRHIYDITRPFGQRNDS